MKIDVDSWRTIGMKEFLIGYLYFGSTDEEYVDWMNRVDELEKNKATHLDLSELGIEYLVRIPFEAIEADDLMMGNVLLVEDFKSTPKHRRVAPYKRPSLVKEQREAKGRRGVK